MRGTLHCRHNSPRKAAAAVMASSVKGTVFICVIDDFPFHLRYRHVHSDFDPFKCQISGRMLMLTIGEPIILSPTTASTHQSLKLRSLRANI